MNTQESPTKMLPAQPGVSLTEYAILIGLVGIVSILSLQALGGSTYNLFADSSTTLKDKGTLSLLNTPASAQSSQQKSGAKGVLYENDNYKLTTDPATGKIAFQLSEGNQGTSSNTTSLDGDKLNTLGTSMIANKFQQLADAESDPAIREYYEELAKASFYLGAAEGKLDGVDALDPNNPNYTSADALRDVITLSQQMAHLLSNPPSNLDKANSTEVIPLAVEVYNIAQTYKEGLSDYIGPDGVRTKEFETTTTVTQTKKPGFLAKLFGGKKKVTTSTETVVASTGTGEPGSVLDTIQKTKPGPIQESYTPYSRLVNYEQLKNKSKEVLAQNNVASVPVESTLVNATTIDTTASGTGAP